LLDLGRCPLEFLDTIRQAVLELHDSLAHGDPRLQLAEMKRLRGLTFLDSNNVTTPDNLFRNDSENGDCSSGLGIDVFLTLVSHIADDEACTITTEWD